MKDFFEKEVSVINGAKIEISGGHSGQGFCCKKFDDKLQKILEKTAL